MLKRMSGASNAGWKRQLEKWRGLDRASQAAAVNAWVNASVAYVPDSRNYGRADYWAAPAETFASGKGDCEDYAIAKYAALKALGFAEDSLRIVVVSDLRRGIGHAILAVKLTNGTYVLDSQDKRILRDDSVPRYAPLYSMNGQGRWINIATRSLRKAKAPVALVASVDVTAISALPQMTPAAPAADQTSIMGLETFPWKISVDKNQIIASSRFMLPILELLFATAPIKLPRPEPTRSVQVTVPLLSTPDSS